MLYIISMLKTNGWWVAVMSLLCGIGHRIRTVASGGQRNNGEWVPQVPEG